MDLYDLLQDWTIARQAERAASLEQRVAGLEHQLRILHQIVLMLLKEKRPDLAHLLQPEAGRAGAAGWRLERGDKGAGVDLPVPGAFRTQDEADAEARRLVREEPQARVFVVGPAGQRYRVLP